MAIATTSLSSHDVEKQPSAPPESRSSRMCVHFTSRISSSLYTELLLLLLTIMTGIQDATTFPDYHCFASNQTGNTIFLTLAVVLPSLNGQMFITSNIAVALTSFLVAGWLTGQLANYFQVQRGRLWLVGCNTLQSILVFVAAALQYHNGVKLSDGISLVTVGLLAFASGSQVVQSRALSTPEISTAMATAAWVDLMIDPHLFQVHGTNRGRNRRICFLVALVIGRSIGASIYRFAGSATAILVSAVGKLTVGIAYLFVPSEIEPLAKNGFVSNADVAPKALRTQIS